MNLRIAAIAVAAAGFAASVIPASADVEVGVLRCHVAPSVGYVIASQRDLDCLYSSNVTGHDHHYVGTAGRVGLDFGVTQEGYLVWGVYAPTRHISRKDLTGTYAGVSAGAAIGVGVGGNALLGGSHRTVTLQPLSGEGSAGLSVALGVTALTLR